ncbi:MAG: hypothetical protein DRG11_04895 [Epsilonproteobacteria bacterium]|nr:MAG: hypothetical protein DRG11_04895 [Campylobacterota bacterium]
MNDINTQESLQKLAVLIDADNAQASVTNGLFAEIAKFGDVSVKRIYGDFTSPHSSSWKKVLQEHAIKPMQQFAYTTGKNATDSSMIIDAMDLLYTRRFDGFCLVTSDSDFTGLAMRLKEAGLKVFGFGEQKTPKAFRNACHKFILTELLRQDNNTNQKEPSKPNNSKTKTTNDNQNEPKPKETKEALIATIEKDKVLDKFILLAIEESSDDTGWAQLGTVGSYLTKLQPDFDPRLYGFKKLSDLIKSKKKIFQTQVILSPSGTGKNLYIKAK